MVCKPDGATDFFDIVIRNLQGDKLAPYLFITYQDCVFRTSMEIIKEKWLYA